MWKIRSLTERDPFRVGAKATRRQRTMEPLYWSNEFGWTWKDMADTFTPEEHETVLLPKGGVWEEQV